MRIRALLATSLTLGALLMLPARGFAGPLFGCTAGTDCNGNAYAVSVVSHVGNTYQLELDIQVLPTYTGNQWTDTVEAVALKDFVSAFSNFSLVSAPGGVGSWTLNQHELDANGCQNGNSHGLCAVAEPGPGFTSGDILSWVFQFDTLDFLNTTSHIKYEYEDASGKKIGSLGSWDIVIQDCTGRTCTPLQQAPEPQTLALLGLGLLALAFGQRKRKI